MPEEATLTLTRAHGQWSGDANLMLIAADSALRTKERACVTRFKYTHTKTHTHTHTQRRYVTNV